MSPRIVRGPLNDNSLFEDALTSTSTISSKHSTKKKSPAVVASQGKKRGTRKTSGLAKKQMNKKTDRPSSYF